MADLDFPVVAVAGCVTEPVVPQSGHDEHRAGWSVDVLAGDGLQVQPSFPDAHFAGAVFALLSGVLDEPQVLQARRVVLAGCGDGVSR